MPGCNCGSKRVTYTVTTSNGTKLTGIASQSEAADIANANGGTVARVTR